MKAQLTAIPRAGLAAVALLAVTASALPLAAQAATGAARHEQARIHAVAHPILGVDLYATSNPSQRIVRRDGIRDLTYIKDTLKASSVGIAWNFYTPADSSENVGHTRNTLTMANVAILARTAKADGLSVEFRPLVKVQRGSPWEGYVFPPNQAAWFNSYFKTELPYLQLAQRLHIREFVFQTELRDLNKSPLWGQFIRRVKRVYGGIVSYAALGAQYYPRSRHLLPVRYDGQTAYPKLNVPATTKVPALVKAWKRYYAAVPPRIRFMTAIDESGIPAMDGAYRNPSAWRKHGTRNDLVQARFFTAECTVVKDLGLRAVYFWNVNLTTYPYSKPASPVTITGRAKSVAAIAGCAKLFAR
jgi:hypothetical protein